jgi:hypothetical protein
MMTTTHGLSNAYTPFQSDLEKLIGEPLWSSFKFRGDKSNPHLQKYLGDFIFVSPSLKTTAVFAPPSFGPHGIPCDNYGSDHIAIGCDLMFASQASGEEEED